MRIHLVAAVLVIGLCVYLQLERTECAILFLTIGTVIAAEVVNTAIEAVVDLASPEHAELARIAKDSAAGGVLVVSITAVVIGVLILGPPLLERIRLLNSW